MRTVVISIIFIGLMFFFFLARLEPTQQHVDVIEGQGITNVDVGGYAWYGCPKDQFGLKFTGTGVNGKPVSGYICQESIFNG